MEQLLKFITCGSVDDGKSTLIGHILYDAKLLYADQEKALLLDSRVGSRGGKIDYSLLLDGLMEEREQGITIDVAYRYFTTSKRSFIVADTPGHEQYTRNMAVGASFADLAILLLDAQKGVLAQTRRHARICRLMGIRYYVFAVNKMDLTDYSREVFEKISREIEGLTGELGIEHWVIIPVSATEGDNVTKKGEHTPWYPGPALLDYLETVDIEAGRKEEGFYLPVQRVCRPDQNFRGFQGQIESGCIAEGEEIRILPGGERAKVKEIYRTWKKTDSAWAGEPVTITLDREIDVSRGCVMTKGTELHPVSEFTADILWMDSRKMRTGSNFFVKVGTSQIPCTVSEILYKTEVNTGEKLPADCLEKNEMGECRIRLADRIVADTFENHRTLGELILIDRVSFMTCACGVIRRVGHSGETAAESSVLREALLMQKTATLEFVKQDISSRKLLERVERRLLMAGRLAYLYDAADLGDGEEDIRLIRQVTGRLMEAGVIVLLLVREAHREKLKPGEQYFRCSFLDMGDEESLLRFVKIVSSYDSYMAVNGDYI